MIIHMRESLRLLFLGRDARIHVEKFESKLRVWDCDGIQDEHVDYWDTVMLKDILLTITARTKIDSIRNPQFSTLQHKT